MGDVHTWEEVAITSDRLLVKSGWKSHDGKQAHYGSGENYCRNNRSNSTFVSEEWTKVESLKLRHREEGEEGCPERNRLIIKSMKTKHGPQLYEIEAHSGMNEYFGQFLVYI